MRAKYFLPYRAAIDTMYRFYTDTWGVLGHTGELGYVHPIEQRKVDFRSRLRYYTQEAADFYQDIFPRADYANFMARDKELATYSAITAGVGATYEFKIQRFPWLTKGQLNLRYDFMTVELRRLPRCHLQSRQFRRSPAGRVRAGHRAAVQARSQHHPVLHLGVFLRDGIVL